MQLCPAATIEWLLIQVQLIKGKNSVLSLMVAFPLEASATFTVESWATQQILFPSGEKLTLCTHPPPDNEFENSAKRVPSVVLEPQGVGSGAFSMSLMWAENTLT